MYRTVLNAKTKRDDQYFDGRPPPGTDSGLVFPARDGDVYLPSAYDIKQPTKSQKLDIHVELPMSFQNRNGKDKRLTTMASVHTVNPRDPKRTDFLTPSEYTRQSNKLQHFSSGVACRVENINGKRKVRAAPVRPSNVMSVSVNNAYNEPTPTPNTDADTVTIKDTMPDTLSNYPQLVQFTLDTMQSTPAGVPDSGVGESGFALATSANASYAASVGRFMQE